MHWKPERADVMAVTLAGNHPSSPLSASLWSRTGERRRSSETGKKVQGPRGTLRASSEHTPSLLYHNQSLSTNPGTVCDFGFTGYSQGGKHPNVFHYLKKKKKKETHTSLGALGGNASTWSLVRPHWTHLGSLPAQLSGSCRGWRPLGTRTLLQRFARPFAPLLPNSHLNV